MTVHIEELEAEVVAPPSEQRREQPREAKPFDERKVLEAFAREHWQQARLLAD